MHFSLLVVIASGMAWWNHIASCVAMCMDTGCAGCNVWKYQFNVKNTYLFNTRYSSSSYPIWHTFEFVVVVVVLTLIRIIKSVVTGQAPVTLELRNTPGKNTHNPRWYTHISQLTQLPHQKHIKVKSWCTMVHDIDMRYVPVCGMWAS